MTGVSGVGCWVSGRVRRGFFVLASIALSSGIRVGAQESPTPQAPAPVQPQAPPAPSPNPQSAIRNPQLNGPQSETIPLGQLGMDMAKITIDGGELINGSQIRGKNAVIVIGEYTLSGGEVSGDLDKEIVFTGAPKLTYRGQTVTGDSIRFKPKTKEYRVENLHTALTPDFLKGQILTPLFLDAADIFGQRKKPIFGEDIDATTCILPEQPHYLIRASEIKLEPGKRITLKRATFYVFGHRIITLPTFVIPLDRDPRRLHSSHMPYVGRSIDEGWFAKSAFDYALADRAPGIFRFDLMEKKGVGLGMDQAWNLLKSVGAAAFYFIPTSGLTNNLSGRFNVRQNIGGGQTITLDDDFRKNSYLALPSTTTNNSRFSYDRTNSGYTTNLNLSRMATDSAATTFGGATHSDSLSTSFAQGVTLGRSTQLTLNADYSQYSNSTAGTTSGSTTTGGFSQRTEQLNTRFQADQRASNYLLQLSANKSIPIGSNNQQSFFGGVEKLPEVTLSNYRFTEGLLARLPAMFMISAGKYTEGSFSSTGSGGGGVISTERAIAGFDINQTRIPLSGTTDLNVAGGFQQYFYGDGSAQYVLRDNTTLSQRWGHKSGVNFNYTYQRPYGGTPFRFDQQGQFHALNADAGWLDDRHLQLTARVGYDFSQSNFGGLSTPWQTLSANLLVRPVDWARWRTLLSFDPNTSQFVSATTDIRFRGHNDFALDLVGRYDPRAHKFGSINSYLNLPIGREWRLIALVQYNGYLGRFESRNLQITRSWDCLEASLTYIDNPFGFRNDKQFFFNLRIKAFPFFQQFGVGQFGQAIGTSVGDVY
jgi:hypothetical protein